MATPCKFESDKMRQCLSEKRSSGRKCDGTLAILEKCREKWRSDNSIELKFDGRRIVPPKQCRKLNCEMQRCLHNHKADEVLCADMITALKTCMDTGGAGEVVPPPRR